MSLKKINIASDALSVSKLREIVQIDSSEGDLVWLVRPEAHFLSKALAARWNGKYAGKAALTSLDARGYRRGEIDGLVLYAHRVVFALANGRWPVGEVDHIDRNKRNNAPANLRDVTHRDNRLNSDDCDIAAARRSAKAAAPKAEVRPSLIAGIRRQGKSTWSVRKKADSQERHIGTFRCFGQAVKARLSA